MWHVKLNKHDMLTGDPYADHDFFTDGLWHAVHIDIMASQGATLGRINITVDGRPDVSNRQLRFSASTDFYIGGDSYCAEFHMPLPMLYKVVCSNFLVVLN
jgi:hypothetical protein